MDIEKIFKKHLGYKNPTSIQDHVDFDNYVFKKHILAATKEILEGCIEHPTKPGYKRSDIVALTKSI